MLPRRAKARLAAVTGLLTAVLLALASSALVGSAAAAPATAPTHKFGYLCSNGGAGLCLQENGNVGSLVANDNKIAGSPKKQQWKFLPVGVTTTISPLAIDDVNGTLVNLNDPVTPGRAYGRWQGLLSNSGSAICLAEQGLEVVMASCSGVGTEWILSGSGSLISVQATDTIIKLEFLNSSGQNGGNPVVHQPHACPAGCWGPAAG